MRGEALNRALNWAIMRARRTFTLADLPADGAKKYVHFLQTHGYIETIDPGYPQKGIPATYKLIKNTGACPPRKRAGGIYDPNCAGRIEDPRLRIWAALRRAKGWIFLQELAANAETDLQTTRKYIRRLERIGYIQACRIRGREKGLRLIQSTGSAAPIPDPDAPRVFDPNLNLFIEEVNRDA